jgi:hypothetical protein
MKEYMIQGFGTHLGCFDENAQVFYNTGLTGEVFKTSRPDSIFIFKVGRTSRFTSWIKMGIHVPVKLMNTA